MPAYVGNPGGSDRGSAGRSDTETAHVEATVTAGPGPNGVAEATGAVQPPELAAAGQRHRGTFGSLRVANYRRYAGGQIVSLIGTWMQRVAQDWLVLELSGGNPIALGVAIALQFGPTLLLTLWAGVLADRLDKRRLLLATQVSLAGFALVLGVLDVSGVVELWQVYVFCLLVGCAAAVEQPVRQSFVMEMVGREQLVNAVALNSMTFNTARIVGPGIAGLLIAAVGTGWVFVINAASFATTVLALLTMNRAKLYLSERVPRARGQLREGLRYVLAQRQLTLVMVLVFFVATFGLNFNATLPVVVRNVFDRGPEAYGLLSTMLAVGTLAGATLAARRAGAGARPRLRVVVVAAMAFGAMAVVVGLMPTYTAFGLMLVPAGAAVMTFLTAANATVQLAVTPTMRGRVMALYMLVLIGGMPIGSPIVGWTAATFGPQVPIVAGGALSFVAAGVCGLLMLRSRRRFPDHFPQKES